MGCVCVGLERRHPIACACAAARLSVHIEFFLEKERTEVHFETAVGSRRGGVGVPGGHGRGGHRRGGHCERVHEAEVKARC